MNLTSVDLHKQLNFIEKPIIDFFHAVYLYGNYEEALQIYNDRSMTLDKEIIEVMQHIDQNLSAFVKNEIKTLSYLGTYDCLLIYFVSEFEELQNVDDFFEKYSNVPIESLFEYIGWAFLCSYSSGANHREWLKVSHSLTEMKNFISSREDVVEGNLIEQVIELFEAPEETKMRLKYSFEQFYKKGYQPFEAIILNKSKVESQRYIQLLHDSPEEFIEINLRKASINGTNSFQYRQYNVYLSYMQQYGYTIFTNNYLEKANGVISIGCRNIEYFNEQSIAKKFDKFLKIIADPTRFKIMSHVGKNSWYVHGLAKELELTPATIHYHLETLHSLDIVTSFKEGNKVMYRLNEDTTKQYLNYLTKKIFH